MSANSSVARGRWVMSVQSSVTPRRWVVSAQACHVSPLQCHTTEVGRVSPPLPCQPTPAMSAHFCHISPTLPCPTLPYQPLLPCQPTPAISAYSCHVSPPLPCQPPPPPAMSALVVSSHQLSCSTN